MSFLFTAEKDWRIWVPTQYLPLQTERSTIWAKPPVLENLGEKSANDKGFLITADLTRKPEKILRLSVSKQN